MSEIKETKEIEWAWKDAIIIGSPIYNLLTRNIPNDIKALLSHIFTLKEKVKELEGAHQMAGIMLNSQQNQIEQDESRIKVLMEEGGQDCRQHNLMVEQLSERIKELEHDLFELNGKYSSRVKELYEAESGIEDLEELISKLGPEVEALGASSIDDRKCIEELEFRIKVLEGAIEKHKGYPILEEEYPDWARKRDEELYKTRNEI